MRIRRLSRDRHGTGAAFPETVIISSQRITAEIGSHTHRVRQIRMAGVTTAEASSLMSIQRPVAADDEPGPAGTEPPDRW
jgi:hypothetical protein